jgi:hypothetical protein
MVWIHSNSGVRAFRFTFIDIVGIVGVDPVFEIFAPFLFLSDSAFMALLVSVAHTFSFLFLIYFGSGLGR